MKKRYLGSVPLDKEESTMDLHAQEDEKKHLLQLYQEHLCAAVVGVLHNDAVMLTLVLRSDPFVCASTALARR